MEPLKKAWNYLLFILIVLVPSGVLAMGSRGPQVGFGSYGEPNTAGKRVLGYLLAILFGALAGAFFSERLRKLRRFVVLSLFALIAITAIFKSDALGYVIFFFAAAFVAYFLLRLPRKAGEEGEAEGKKTTFGSAEWATAGYLKEEYAKKKGLLGNKGLFLGTFPAGKVPLPLHYKGDRHLLTVAPTRAGKGVSSIIPNLLTYEGSALVIDPKGENAFTAGARRAQGHKGTLFNFEGMGQRVHVVNPWGLMNLPSSCFNPLDWLNPEDEDINENAMILADAMVITNDAAAKEKFWDEEAKALLMGFLLHVVIDPEEEGQRHLGRVRDLICQDSLEFNETLDRMSQSSNAIVRSTAARTISKEDRLKSNVIASLQAHTHFLDSPRLRKNLSKSDFRFEDLKRKKMTVFLVLPADRLETFSRWLRLLIQQALTVNARNIANKPEKPVLFLLDEMQNLGNLSMVKTAYSLMAGFGMQLWGIVQDLSQLEMIYGKAWESFIGNSGVLQYYGSRDHKTAEYFSKLCGVTTIEKFSISQSISRAINWGRSWSSGGRDGSTTGTSDGGQRSYSSSDTKDVVQRQLVYPDELMVLKKDRMLTLVENLNPIAGHKIRWYEDTVLKTLGVNLEKLREQTRQKQQQEKKPPVDTTKKLLDPTKRKANDTMKKLPEPTKRHEEGGNNGTHGPGTRPIQD